MKLRILTLLALFCALCATTGAAAKPNIVLIFADDLGWRDVGYQGSDFHDTPNLDRLAKQGMRFSHAYAAAGNCAPSRACLLSGTYTPRHHVYAVNSTERGPKDKMRLTPVPNKSGLSRDTITIADALKSAGYATGIFGKWHLGGPDGAPPSAQGFDTVENTYRGAEEGGESKPTGKMRPPETKDESDPKGAFSLTRAALEFIEANRERPFFCYLSHHAIHGPIEARPETFSKFKAKERGAQHKHALYAACVYELDAAVGEFMAKLDALGLAENTLVIVTSDNGPTMQSSQEPLRGSKGGYYEGGIAVPFLARWPGVVKAGAECRVPVNNVDLFPTFLAAAGAPVPKDKTLDGESLLPLLRGEGELQRSAIFWHFPGYLDQPVIRGRDPVFRTRPVTVIRKGDWKLHLYHEEWLLDGGRGSLATNHALELYNMAADRGEHSNRAADEPARRDELLADLLAWLKATNAPLPTVPQKPGAL